MTTPETILDQSVAITSLLLLGGMLLAFIRLIKGPDAADRIVALDLISLLIVGLLAVLAISADETSFLDVSIAYALVAFLGTVALARFRMRSGAPPDRDAADGRRGP
jgi:multicomponent Na+:H+ antiporter subunit F